ncbi:MAG TPA: DNA-binding protein [Anaerolineae bacterium]|nr:DNA-binding protein [Anaerolineae bacterium]
MSEISYLQLHLARGIGPATIRRVLARLTQTGISLEEFLHLSSKEQVTKFGLARQQAEALGAARVEAERIRAELEQRGVALLTLASLEYPIRLRQRLGNQAPPLLYAWGNLDLLQKNAVGFCGARDVSAKGIAVAKDCAAQIASWGWVVVSGGARGVDTATHRAALMAGGTTVIVLPEGILRYRPRRELNSLVSQEQVLLISEFPPHKIWSVANAMRRNRTICGLSEALIVIESGTSGGTFEAGKLALRLKMPLFVAEYAEPAVSAAGNAYFLAHGARPLRRSAETGQANLEPLRRAVETCSETEPVAIQEWLF